MTLMENFAVTDRLLLRRFKKDDTEALYEYRADSEIAKYQSWENYQYHEAESFVDKQLNNLPICQVLGSSMQLP